MFTIRPLSLLIILGIVIVLFGSKRLRELGGDLAATIKGFREGMNSEAEKPETILQTVEDKVVENKADVK